MAVKIRLARAGTHKRPFYWVVAADSAMPRDGRYIEKLGVYNPSTDPRTLELKTDRINYWLDHGGKPSDAVRELLRDEGILRSRAGGSPKKDVAADAPAETGAPAEA